VIRTVLCTILLAWSALVQAHKQSDSYLTITQPAEGATLDVQWDIALRDLEHAIGVDTNADAAITWGELKQRLEPIVAYTTAHLQLVDSDSNEPRDCPLRFQRLLVDEHVDGRYAVLRFAAGCPVRPAKVEIRYSLLFDIDPNHRGLVDARSAGNSHAAVLAKDSNVATLDLAATGGPGFGSFINEGIWHIWQGYDHVLFLLTLLLPAVVLYRDRQWQPRESLRESLLDVVKVVTAFTLAHSLTLTLGTLGWVYLPTRIVESAIATTVLLGALNILFPVVRERRWLVAFCFGLIHGLGFASVLIDLGLSGWSLARALVGFNGGVEIGQLAIVLVMIPMMYASRRTSAYRRFLLPVGAVLVACLAVYWMVERWNGVLIT
jgi:hypothetical protein